MLQENEQLINLYLYRSNKLQLTFMGIEYLILFYFILLIR